MKVYKFEDYGILPPPIDTIVETCMCARRKARGTEQNRGGSSWLPQAKAASVAGTLAAENISIGAARVFEVHRF